jgi:Icc-related predicted phosphoesterase
MERTIVAVSDLHGVLPDIPVCDLLLIAGDVCPIVDHSLPFQAQWLETSFRSWLHSVPTRKIIFIAGNHDLIYVQRPQLAPSNLPAVYLQDSGVEWEGIRIWVTPWQPRFFDWAFNLDEPDLATKWDLIPADTDILVVHGPPRGYGDGVPERGGTRLAGSPSLLKWISAVRPRLVVFGHIHEGRGEWLLGDTVLANVTILDARYRHAYEPWKHSLVIPPEKRPLG